MKKESGVLRRIARDLQKWNPDVSVFFDENCSDTLRLDPLAEGLNLPDGFQYDPNNGIISGLGCTVKVRPL